MDNSKQEHHRTLTRGDAPLDKALEELHTRNLVASGIMLTAMLIALAAHLWSPNNWYVFFLVFLVWMWQAECIRGNHRKFEKAYNTLYPRPYRYNRRRG